MFKSYKFLMLAGVSAIAAAFAIPAAVHAATSTPGLTVSANVAAAPDSCTFVDTGLTFTGLQAGLATATAASTNISITCTHAGGSNVTITQNNTTDLVEDNPADPANPAKIDYKVFAPNTLTPSQSTTDEWIGQQIELPLVGSTPATVRIGAEVAAVPSTSPAGDYSDTFVLTLSFAD